MKNQITLSLLAFSAMAVTPFAFLNTPLLINTDFAVLTGEIVGWAAGSSSFIGGAWQAYITDGYTLDDRVDPSRSGFAPSVHGTMEPATRWRFSITSPIPSDASLNIVQVGFRNSGIENTAGQMTISNLSVTVVPEPSSFALFGGLMALGFMVRRRR